MHYTSLQRCRKGCMRKDIGKDGANWLPGYRLILLFYSGTIWFMTHCEYITLALLSMVYSSISSYIQWSWISTICRLVRQKFSWELVKWRSWIHAEQGSLIMLQRLFKGRLELILPVNIFSHCTRLPSIYKHYGGVCLLESLTTYSFPLSHLHLCHFLWFSSCLYFLLSYS